MSFTISFGYLFSLIILGGCILLESPLYTSNEQCYGQFNLNITCPVSTVIAINTIYVGTKTITPNCTGILSDECCTSSDSDCTFHFPTTYNTGYFDNCNGYNSCIRPAERAATTSDCPVTVYQDFSNYMFIDFYCIENHRIGSMQAGLDLSVEATMLYLRSPGYTDTNTPSSLTQMNCSVETDLCFSIIEIFTVERNLATDSNGTCKQSLVITNPDGAVIVNWTCSSNTYNLESLVGMTDSYITVHFTNTLSVDSGRFWIGFHAHGNLSIKCPAEERVHCMSSPTISTSTSINVPTSNPSTTTSVSTDISTTNSQTTSSSQSSTTSLTTATDTSITTGLTLPTSTVPPTSSTTTSLPSLSTTTPISGTSSTSDTPFSSTSMFVPTTSAESFTSDTSSLVKSTIRSTSTTLPSSTETSQSPTTTNNAYSNPLTTSLSTSTDSNVSAVTTNEVSSTVDSATTSVATTNESSQSSTNFTQTSTNSVMTDLQTTTDSSSFITTSVLSTGPDSTFISSTTTNPPTMDSKMSSTITSLQTNRTSVQVSTLEMTASTTSSTDISTSTASPMSSTTSFTSFTTSEMIPSVSTMASTTLGNNDTTTETSKATTVSISTGSTQEKTSSTTAINATSEITTLDSSKDTAQTQGADTSDDRDNLIVILLGLIVGLLVLLGVMVFVLFIYHRKSDSSIKKQTDKERPNDIENPPSKPYASDENYKVASAYGDTDKTESPVATTGPRTSNGRIYGQRNKADTVTSVQEKKGAKYNPSKPIRNGRRSGKSTRSKSKVDVSSFGVDKHVKENPTADSSEHVGRSQLSVPKHNQTVPETINVVPTNATNKESEHVAIIPKINNETKKTKRKSRRNKSQNREQTSQDDTIVMDDRDDTGMEVSDTIMNNPSSSSNDRDATSNGSMVKPTAEERKATHTTETPVISKTPKPGRSKSASSRRSRRLRRLGTSRNGANIPIEDLVKLRKIVLSSSTQSPEDVDKKLWKLGEV